MRLGKNDAYEPEQPQNPTPFMGGSMSGKAGRGAEMNGRCYLCKRCFDNIQNHLRMKHRIEVRKREDLK